ncbi:hypothetical protein LT493_10060 [Streptomyces tricolor]|nr:hypothetical protein [Streptomyces tricolor]
MTAAAVEAALLDLAGKRAGPPCPPARPGAAWYPGRRATARNSSASHPSPTRRPRPAGSPRAASDDPQASRLGSADPEDDIERVRVIRDAAPRGPATPRPPTAPGPGHGPSALALPRFADLGVEAV